MRAVREEGELVAIRGRGELPPASPRLPLPERRSVRISLFAKIVFGYVLLAFVFFGLPYLVAFIGVPQPLARPL